MNTEWIKETNELLEDLEAREQILQDKYEQLRNELLDLQQRIVNGHELIRDYMIKHPALSTTPDDIKPGSLVNKSYPKMLIEIAKQSNGILNLNDTVDILFRANIDIDKKKIRHNIDTALSRSSEHFARINKGQYRFTNHVQVKKVGEGKKTRIRESSGVRDAVKALKDKNPQMTKKDVVTHLMTTGFDFKGKKPVPAVNMVWVKLGYSKEGKQQHLIPIA